MCITTAEVIKTSSARVSAKRAKEGCGGIHAAQDGHR
jgi:hypothetical protein